MYTTIVILGIASVGIVCFALLDYVLLRRLHDSTLRRIGLLLAMVSVLLVPLIGANLPVRLPWLSSEVASTETPWTIDMLLALSEDAIQAVEVPWWQDFDWISLLGWIWIVGVIIATLVLAVRLLSLICLISRSRASGQYAGIGIYIYERERIPPFSTIGRIFIPEHLSDSALREHILLHEASHIQSYHMLDSLLSEIFCIVYWFHPLAYILRREQRANLEYCADKDVLDSGQVNKRAYQLDLISMSASSETFPLCLSFRTKEVLKQRIIMMNYSQSPRTSLRWGLMLALPIVGAMLSIANAWAVTPKNAIVDESIPEIEASVATAKQMQTPQKDNQIFHVVDTPAEFPGGVEAMLKWLASNVRYPEQAQKENASGRVFVSFVIDTDGTIRDPEVVRSVHPSLDQEALRVTRAMPRWTPGKHQGKVVKMKYTIPILFRMTGKKEGSQSKLSSQIILVDGKEVTAEELKNISPDRIASMNIIKGEKAIAIYGAKAQEGAVVIETKKEGEEDSSHRLTIQGNNATASTSMGNNYLIIFDGKEVSAEEIKDLKGKIRTVSIIKGDSATALYGPKAKDGAVVITINDKANK